MTADPTPSTHSEETLLPPLTIQLERLEQTQNGYWRPGAFVKFTSSLRTSGFLNALPAEDLKNLLFLLSFVTPNGDVQPTVGQLADAMQVSQAKVLARMQRLEKFVWQGQPVAIFLARENGLNAYTVSSHAVPVQDVAANLLPSPAAIPEPLAVASRDAVITHSREHYGRPRAEVERLIEQQIGWQNAEDDAATAHVRQRLVAVGVSKEQADFLIGNFELERIERQLDWLPYRNARRPAHFLIAAIEDDYEEPFDLRLQKLTADSGTLEESASRADDAVAGEAAIDDDTPR